MIPRYGERIVPDKRYRLRPGIYAVLPRGTQVLLTREHGDAPEIQLPGGGIDPGEPPIAALHREVMEETGWKIATPRRLGVFRRFVYMPDYDLWAEKLCSVYVARPVLRVSRPLELHHEPLWVSITEAAKILGNAGDRALMSKYAGAST